MQVITYSNPLDRPEVEVRVDGEWHFGTLTQWQQHEDDSWTARVVWSRTLDGFPQTRGDSFAADVRPNETDWSRGRSVALAHAVADEPTAERCREDDEHFHG